MRDHGNSYTRRACSALLALGRLDREASKTPRRTHRAWLLPTTEHAPPIASLPRRTVIWPNIRAWARVELA